MRQYLRPFFILPLPAFLLTAYSFDRRKHFMLADLPRPAAFQRLALLFYSNWLLIFCENLTCFSQPFLLTAAFGQELGSWPEAANSFKTHSFVRHFKEGEALLATTLPPPCGNFTAPALSSSPGEPQRVRRQMQPRRRHAFWILHNIAPLIMQRDCPFGKHRFLFKPASH